MFRCGSAAVNPKKTFWPIVLTLAASGAVAWWVSRRTWGSSSALEASLPMIDSGVVGADAVPLVTACALVVLAGALALTVTGRRGRAVISIITAVAAAVGLWTAATAHGAVERSVTRRLGELPGAAHSAARDALEVDVSFWPWVAAAAFLVAVLGCAASLRWSRHWPTMSARYDAPGSSNATADTRTQDDHGDVWKAFDEGKDPTE